MKEWLKTGMLWLSVLAVAPLLGMVLVCGWVWGRKRAFESGGQWVSVIPGGLGNALRTAYYFTQLKSFHPTARVCLGSVICDPRSEVGSHVYVGTYCEFGWVSIGNDTLIASRVMIPSGKRVHHFDRLDVPIRMQGGAPEAVRIGEDCWIGTGAIVMADVGCKTVVAAGSVVAKPLPEKSVCVGSPASVRRQR